MRKVHKLEGGGFLIFCPGCECGHKLDSRWTFNGDMIDKPTFTPSYVVETEKARCHSHITDGKIQFLDDSTHKLKGQAVELPLF